MGRGPIPRRPRGGFPTSYLCTSPLIRHYHMFPCAIPDQGAGCPRVTHPSAASVPAEAGPFARLACLRRAASVRSEPGSNSPSWLPRAKARGSFSLQFSPASLTNRLDSLISPCSSELTKEASHRFLFLHPFPFAFPFKNPRRFPRRLNTLPPFFPTCQLFSQYFLKFFLRRLKGC